MESASQDDDFDIAKAVSEKLRGLPKEKQERILRWVTEGIGLSMPSIIAPPGASSHGILSSTMGEVRGAPSSGSSDIKSFIASKTPKSDQQFAASVAYYYRFEAPPADRKNFITGENLQEAARLAGHRRLGKPITTLNNAKNAGYLDSGSPGEFAINSVGENLVAMTLPGGADDSPSRTKSTKVRKKKSIKTRR